MRFTVLFMLLLAVLLNVQAENEKCVDEECNRECIAGGFTDGSCNGDECECHVKECVERECDMYCQMHDHLCGQCEDGDCVCWD